MRVTLLFERIVRCPTIADDLGARFDPSTNNGRQRFSGSILNGNEKRSTSTAFDATKYSLALNMMSAIIFLPTKLALIYLNGLIRTADLLRAALQVDEHGL
jgi:hypothetical protein